MVSSPTVIIPKFRPKEDRAWWDGVMRGIRLGIGKEKVLQEQRMKDMARAEQEIQRKTVDGLGQLTAIIPTDVYLRWDQYAPGCWNDKQFGREFLRDNPSCRAAKPVKRYF
jgi:hypothetical protein